MMIRLVSLLLLIIISVGGNQAYSQQSVFCRTVFGAKAQLAYVPEAANKIGISHNYLTGKTTYSPSKDAKTIVEPTGFRCRIGPKQSESCPKDMSEEIQGKENRYCISKVYDLRELCPDEISSRLKERVCNTH